jgi:outer membrane autotransporter protein
MSTPDAADYTGQSVQLQVYGSVTRGILFVDAQAGGVFNEGTARRTLSLEDVGLTGDANGDGFGGSIRGGARFDVSGWNIEPSLTLGGLSISQYGLTENGSNPLRVAVGGTSIDSVQTLLGVQVDHRFPINRIYAIVPSVNAGWSYEMLDTSTPVSANFVAAPDAAFGVTGASIGRSAAVAGVHATLETSSALQVFAGYDAILDSQFAAQTITGGIRYIW